ncbi:MAG: hypothetical protein HOM21_15995 [Halobacteriovoraceae bacterium]|nr:hypothetical protein [Halobacteriovoraceae bacterium]
MSVEKSKKETVLVGMTGRRDSTVAAYLLKKQGYHVIGIGISFSDSEVEESEEKDEEEEEESSEPLTSIVLEEVGTEFGVHIIHDLQKVKDVCDRLEIDFYAVNAKELYRSRLQEFMIAARLQGISFSPTIYCSNIIMDVLLSKMEKLKGNLIATGHYCKIHKNQVTEEFSVMMANDIANDQSFELCRLREKHLKNLIFPLSDMRKVEVNKVVELLGIELEDGDSLEHNIPMEDPRLTMLILDQTPESLRKEGSVINLKEDTVVCDHTGCYQFYIGQDKLAFEGGATVEKSLTVVNITPGNGGVYLGSLDDFYYKIMYLKKFHSEFTFDNAKPIECYVKWGRKTEKSPCILYFKNNKIVSAELKDKAPGILPPGIILVFYNRQGIGGRVIGSAVLIKAGRAEDGKIVNLPPPEDDPFDEKIEDKYAIKLDPSGHKF